MEYNVELNRKAHELISNIHLNEANIEYILSTGKINGILYGDLLDLFTAGCSYNAELNEFISVSQKLPSKDRCGERFLVRIMDQSGNIDYEISEWFNPLLDDEEDDGVNDQPLFIIEHSWCGQQVNVKFVTHWKEIPIE